MNFLFNEEGLIPEDKGKSTPSGKETWKVRAATFEFSVTCKFAIENATVITPTSQGDKDPVKGTGKSICANPMYTMSPIKSSLSIKVILDNDYVINEEFSTEPLWNMNKSIGKDVPLALWGECVPSSLFSLFFFILDCQPDGTAPEPKKDPGRQRYKLQDL
jgi:hypothetical protein